MKIRITNSILKTKQYLYISLTLFFFFTIFGCSSSGDKNQTCSETALHSQLRKSLNDTITKFNGTVGLSVIELETGDTLSINSTTNFAMQSVYKFPLSLVLMHKVEKGEISLDQKILLNKNLLDHYKWSPLKRQNPGSDFYMTVDSLLMYMLAYSDNLACDRIFKLVGGTDVADSIIHKQGFSGIHIKYTEQEMGEEFNRMYQNTSTPVEMTALLKSFFEGKIVNDSSTKHILNLMINDSTSHSRMIGNLPPEIKVAHKTGTGASNDTLVSACNDVGIIYLPNGNHLAVAVFVMNSKENFADTENLIAIVTREIFDYYNNVK
jgi:beta-lactamase class A